MMSISNVTILATIILIILFLIRTYLIDKMDFQRIQLNIIRRDFEISEWNFL